MRRLSIVPVATFFVGLLVGACHRGGVPQPAVAPQIARATTPIVVAPVPNDSALDVRQVLTALRAPRAAQLPCGPTVEGPCGGSQLDFARQVIDHDISEGSPVQRVMVQVGDTLFPFYGVAEVHAAHGRFRQTAEIYLWRDLAFREILRVGLVDGGRDTTDGATTLLEWTTDTKDYMGWMSLEPRVTWAAVPTGTPCREPLGSLALAPAGCVEGQMTVTVVGMVGASEDQMLVPKLRIAIPTTQITGILWSPSDSMP